MHGNPANAQTKPFLQLWTKYVVAEERKYNQETVHDSTVNNIYMVIETLFIEPKWMINILGELVGGRICVWEMVRGKL